MRKKNIYDGYSSKKSQKVKIASSHKENGQSCMNYLAFSQAQLEQTKENVRNKLEVLMHRLNEQYPTSNAKPDEIIKSDQVIKELEEIQRQAKNHDFMDLEKKIVLALGRRILLLEIQSRKQQIEKKKIKKQEIEQSFFRHKKIKKFNYENLAGQKLADNSYIARPYSSGKGFVQSDISYRDLQDNHLDRLQQAQYLGVIKQVNKIYMSNYSCYSAQSRKQFRNGHVINFVLFLCLTLLVLGVVLVSSPQLAYIEYCLLSNIVLILLILSVHGIQIFIRKPNHNNQLEQTKSDVKSYFDKINKENTKKGKKFQWICPDDFMYLEVHFHAE